MRPVPDHVDVGAGAHDPAGVQRRRRLLAESTSPFGQYRLFGSKNMTGSLLAMASWIIQ